MKNPLKLLLLFFFFFGKEMQKKYSNLLSFEEEAKLLLLFFFFGNAEEIFEWLTSFMVDKWKERRRKRKMNKFFQD